MTAGFQSQKNVAFELTVEGTLRAALNAAGLIADSNMDEWRRIKWSRSSRTDKGVHSLATVSAMLLCQHSQRFLIGVQQPQDLNPMAVANSAAPNPPLQTIVPRPTETAISFKTCLWLRTTIPQLEENTRIPIGQSSSQHALKKYFRLGGC